LTSHFPGKHPASGAPSYSSALSPRLLAS
jgi:hypothetical protein